MRAGEKPGRKSCPAGGQRLRKGDQPVGVVGGAKGTAGQPGTHQNHVRAVGAGDIVGPGLAGLRGTVPLVMQLQAHGAVPHGVQQLGDLSRLQVVKVDGGTHNLVP